MNDCYQNILLLRSEKKRKQLLFSIRLKKKLWKLAKMNEIMNDRVNEWIENEWIVPKYCFTIYIHAVIKINQTAT